MPNTKQQDKRATAKALYLSGMSMEEIADKVGVTRPTISRWCNDGGWKESRAARNITRPELVNKLLLAIDNLIEQVNASDDPSLLASLGDKLSKLSSVIQKLDKKASVVDAIEVFIAFSKWLEFRAKTDSEITPELLKIINRYQDLYIAEQFNNQ